MQPHDHVVGRPAAKPAIAPRSEPMMIAKPTVSEADQEGDPAP